MTCAPSENLDQPAHPETSLCAHWVAKDASFLHFDSEDSDQTGRKTMLIAGRTVNLLLFFLTAAQRASKAKMSLMARIIYIHWVYTN